MALIELTVRIADDAPDGQAATAHAIHVSCPADLCRILSPETALAVWRRNLAADVGSELTGLKLDEVDDMLFACEIDALATALPGATEQAGYPDLPALTADIALLARQHAAIAGNARVRIRLEVVETDACRKFHSDYVTLRAITTYLGQGTQWTEAEGRDRAGLPGGPEIRQLRTGEVGMFKGRLWQETSAILHRSPPIGNTGARRLVLVIDPAPADEKKSVGLGL
jgi:hypothetical protein